LRCGLTYPKKARQTASFLDTSGSSERLMAMVMPPHLSDKLQFVEISRYDDKLKFVDDKLKFVGQSI